MNRKFIHLFCLACLILPLGLLAQTTEGEGDSSSLGSEEFRSDLDQFLAHEGIKGKEATQIEYLKSLPLLYRIDERKSEAILRTVTGQRNDSEFDITWEDALKRVDEWVKEYLKYQETLRSLNAAVEAYALRRKTMTELKWHLLKVELLSPTIFTMDSPTAYRGEGPKKFVPAPSIDGDKIVFDPMDLETLVPIPERFKNESFVRKQIDIEALEQAQVINRLQIEAELQAIRFVRLKKIFDILSNTQNPRKPHVAAVKVKGNRVDFYPLAATDPRMLTRERLLQNLKPLIDAPVVQSSQTAAEGSEGSQAPAGIVRRPTQQLSQKLAPPKLTLDRVQRARFIDRKLESTPIKATGRFCSRTFTKINHAREMSTKAFEKLVGVPMKTVGMWGVAASGLGIAAAMGTKASIATYNWFRYDKKEREDLEAIAQQKAREEEITKALNALVDSTIGGIEGQEEFVDKFFMFAHQYYKDEGVTIFYEYLIGMRFDLEPAPGDLLKSDGSPGEYQSYQFDHAKSVNAHWRDAVQRVARQLDVREHNLRLKDQMKNVVEKNGLKSLLPNAPAK